MGTVSEEETSKIPAADVRAGLARVLKSEEFQRSPRLSSFLKYIVDMTLKGSAKQLKGYTIGIEVFGKPDSFDPEQDASVRVDATRLRRVLKAYYSGSGEGDPIRISVATGTYVPKFERREGSLPVASNKPFALLQKMNIYGCVLAVIALLILGAGFGSATSYFFMRNLETKTAPGFNSTLLDILKRPTGATVAVLPLKPLGDEGATQIAAGFDYQLLNDLTRFKSLRVFGRETVKVFAGYNLSPYEIATRLMAQYVVEGSLQRSGEKTRIKVRLLDISTHTYIWSYESDENIRPDNLFHIQTKIVGEIAARLGQPYGVVQRMETRRLRGVKAKYLVPYKCVLSHYEYASHKVAEKHAQMRDCLEQAVKDSPDYTEAWALLSWIYGDEIRYGHNLKTSVEDALKRSEDAAIKALDTNPESPRAHQHAASVALLKKDIAGVRRHLKIALALNPNDAEILAYAGWLYSQLGDWELSRSLVEKAIWLNPGHPPWYQGILFAYHYHQRNYERALTHALAFYQPDVLLSSIAIAAVYGKLAKVSEGADAVIHLETTFPEFTANPRARLQVWKLPEPLITNLLEGLADAGMVISTTG